jgi:hypothetical protein
MRAKRLMAQQDAGRKPLASITDVDVRSGPKAAHDVVDVGAVLDRAHGIMQLEWLLIVQQLLGHGEEGRDADAAGNHEVLARVMSHLEQVDRTADVQHCPGRNRVVHQARAAAPVIVQPHADDVSR